MKKLLILILFTGVLLASTSQIFLQHLRVNGIEDFKIKNNTLIIYQSGPLLKGELLEEVKNNGIKKVIYFVNNKNKSGYKNYFYIIKDNKLVLKNIVNPFYKEEELAAKEVNKAQQIKKLVIEKIKLLSKECNLGNSAKCNELGLLYNHGFLHKKIFIDYTKAYKLFKKSCDSNNGYGCMFFGLAYFEGKGVPKDIHKAKQLFKKSCVLGARVGCNIYSTLLKVKEK